MRTKYPEYNKALRYYIDGNIRYFNRARKATELSYPEKKLLEARSLFIKKEWDSAYELLSTIQTPCPFLNGDLYFLRAYCHSRKGEFAAAAGLLEQSICYYDQAKDRRGGFLAHYNSSVAYNRLRKIDQEEEHLNQALQLATHASETILILRGQACLFSNKSDHERAVHFIEQALNMDIGELDINENDKLNLLSVAVDIYFRAGRPAKSMAMLEELKLSKINSAKARVSFEHYILKAHMNQQKLDRMPLAIKNSTEYTLKWDLLKMVQTGQIQEAEKKWQELADLFPEIYGLPFELRDPSLKETIFFTYLDAQFESEQVDFEEINKLHGKNLKRLYKILIESPIPLSKENLIEKIWGIDYSPEFDNRFYQLMKRLKQRVNRTVTNKNNCYKIQGKKSA